MEEVSWANDLWILAIICVVLMVSEMPEKVCIVVVVCATVLMVAAHMDICT